MSPSNIKLQLADKANKDKLSAERMAEIQEEVPASCTIEQNVDFVDVL